MPMREMPRDAFEIEGFKPDQRVKVPAQPRRETVSQSVNPASCSLRVVVDPANASDAELAWVRPW